MNHPLNVELAMRIGLRTALVAQYLWESCDERFEGRIPSEIGIFDGRAWLKMSQRTLTVVMPYLTRHTARYELSRLQRLGIVRARALSDVRFDHTNWYTFTEHGHDLMFSTGCDKDMAP